MEYAKSMQGERPWKLYKPSKKVSAQTGMEINFWMYLEFFDSSAPTMNAKIGAIPLEANPEKLYSTPCL